MKNFLLIGLVLLLLGNPSGALATTKGEIQSAAVTTEQKCDCNCVDCDKKANDNDITIVGTTLFVVVGVGLLAGAVMANKKNREEA